MTHDLFLHPPSPAEAKSFDEIQTLLREAETLAPYVNEEASTPEQIVLADPDTGVWALLTPGQIEEDAEEENPVLHLQIPYARPRFFGIEGALFAVALHQELGYLAEDPGDEKSPGPRVRSEEEMLASWERGNRAALSELDEGEKPKPVDATLLATVFSHNLHRNELRGKAGPSVSVPRLVLASLPMRLEPAVVCRYDAGETVWLPAAATHVVLVRKKKSWLGTKDEQVLVEADALRAALEPFATDAAPAGMRAYGPTPAAADGIWQKLSGPEARGLALLDWNAIADA